MPNFTKEQIAAIELETKRLVREEQGIVGSTVTDNKDNAIEAAKVVAGDTVLAQLTKVAKSKAPMGTGDYIESPVGQIALANALNMAIRQYAPSNPKAMVIAEAVMSAAYIGAAQSFDIPGMIEELLDGVSIPGFDSK